MATAPAATPQTSSGRRALLAQLSGPLRTFVRTEAGSAGLLLTAAVVALAWANSSWSDTYYDLWETALAIQVGSADLTTTLGHAINDGLMTLFFLIIGLEVRRELSVGELTDRSRVAVPLFAGFTGMLVPALIFLALNASQPTANAWGVVIGTDTAFLLGALALVGPKFSTQLRIFLLTLTVIDDVVAVSVIGVAYSESLSLVPLLLAAAAALALVGLGRAGAWRSWPYVIVLGALWATTVAAGLHAAIAGMVGGLLIAAHAPERQVVESAASRFRAFRQSPMAEVSAPAQSGLQRAISVNERMTLALHPWTSYVIVPLFALANAGVDLRHGVLGEALASPLTWGVAAGLVVGKTIGIFGGTWLGVRFGVGRLPQGVAMSHVLGGAALSGIGFTVSLLIIGLAFDDPVLRGEATVGVLIALVASTLLGWLIFWFAARFRGESEADLPRFLDRDVDPSIDHMRGRVDAPYTLVEYGDFECPFCAKATGVARELREQFGDELRYVFRHLPLADVHPQAELAARAAVAADRQGRFWDMHDSLFADQAHLEAEDLVSRAVALGLDRDRFEADVQSDEVAERVRNDVASAEASGARGTPTFFVGTRRHTGPHDTQSLAAALLSSPPLSDRVEPPERA